LTFVPLHRVEQVMGTAVSLSITDALPPDRLERAAQQVFDWLDEVDRRFSTYRDDSEVCRLEREELAAGDCSADTRAVLDCCAELRQQTDGYFDAYATGRLDPSGYVKGWSVQVASDRMLAAGLSNHCLNAGGDVRVRGRDCDGTPWRVGVRHPWLADRTAWVVAGTDLAVATSGSYERGPHVVDPRRGVPARGLCSVTVAGADLGLADAYATAAVAMGRAGLQWLATLPAGYSSAAVTDDGEAYRSDDLPVVEPQPR
jgi:thiamine biosynthesis lipoprotein